MLTQSCRHASHLWRAGAPAFTALFKDVGGQQVDGLAAQNLAAGTGLPQQH